MKTGDSRFGLSVALVLVFVVVVTAVAFWQYYVQHVAQITESAGGRLLAIAELEANEVADWRNDFLDAAKAIAQNPFNF